MPSSCALCRVQQKRTSKKLCINSPIRYCPQVWMKKKTRQKNRIHEKALRFVYNGRNSTLKELLTKHKSVTLHDRSIQVVVTEMFIITIGDIIGHYNRTFPPQECCYKFGNTSQSKSYCVFL